MEQQTKLDKAVKISIIAGALIITLSIAYYLVVFMPQKEKARVEQQKQEQQTKNDDIKKNEEQRAANKKALSFCLIAADISYSDYWNSECKSQGLKDDCRLPEYNADSVEKSKKTDQDNCFKRFPQN